LVARENETLALVVLRAYMRLALATGVICDGISVDEEPDPNVLCGPAATFMLKKRVN
jgi:hypothetical protein